jgi:hypothetical protein
LEIERDAHDLGRIGRWSGEQDRDGKASGPQKFHASNVQESRVGVNRAQRKVEKVFAKEPQKNNLRSCRRDQELVDHPCGPVPREV